MECLTQHFGTDKCKDLFSDQHGKIQYMSRIDSAIHASTCLAPIHSSCLSLIPEG